MDDQGILILARHGQSEGNALNVFTGLRNLPLTDAGRHEARAIARALKAAGYRPDRIFSSALDRAIETAQIIVNTLGGGIPFTSEAALNERDYGDLTGLNKAEAAVRFGFTLRLATPDALRPPQELIDWARAQGGKIELTDDPETAVAGARCVVTDTWVSMSDDPNTARHNLLAPYRVTSALMGKAAADAIFMHCLPAHRGEEVTEEVIDGPQSVVFDEAENRLHAQKGVLAWALGAAR